jgi:CheY-like chemotaxis protein
MSRRIGISGSISAVNIFCGRFAADRKIFFAVERDLAKVHNFTISGLKSGAGRQDRDPAPLDYYRGTETIFVVDDEESLRTVVSDLLTQLGYRVLSATSGAEALTMAAEYSGKIDLLLTDVVMDPISGPELAETLARSRPEMKVVFISGYATTTLAPDGNLKPGTILVNKPFTMKILSAKLREVLGSRTSV